jgi:hypothetical protein
MEMIPLYDPEDTSLILLLAKAGGCSLATSPGDKDNWIERAGRGGKGGKLPNYICRIARAVMRSGKSRSQAISIAVSTVKRWAAGGDDVKADTRAKAAKALAQWEALKAKNAAKTLVKATNADGSEYLFLSQEGMDSFNVSAVSEAWFDLLNRGKVYNRVYIESIWNTHLIVSYTNEDKKYTLKVPYVVKGDTVTFYSSEVLKLEESSLYTLKGEFGGDFESDEDDITEEELEDILSLARFSDYMRESLAKKGNALPDGSFPIVTVADLKNAIHAVGRAKDIEAAKRHIKKRARELGKEDLIPKEW